MSAPAETGTVKRHRRLWPLLIILLVMAGALWSQSGATDVPPGPFGNRVERWHGLASSVAAVTLADLGENPRLTRNPPQTQLPPCTELSAPESAAFADAYALMRGTERGVALYELVLEEGVCIAVAELPYNSAYALSRWSADRGWSESQIVVDRSQVTRRYPDVLAALLVHEATHIERSVQRTACYYVNACTVLPNGVTLEEEIVAHSAEAEWWIAAYGRDGKARAYRDDYAENRLKAAFLRGPVEFRTFISEARSGDHEGDGINE